MKITINGNEIISKPGQTVLGAALDAGIFIPHLCKHPDLDPLGSCRLCVVEDESTGEVLPSCKIPVRDGMKVLTDSQKATEIRKLSMEIILATHPADCTGCPKYGKCELQSMFQFMGVGPERWRKKSRSVADDDSNPLISHLFTRCVRCGRCIRACHDLRGAKVLDYVSAKEGMRAGVPGGKSLKDAGCKFCGACIEVCPTGSIMDTPGLIKEGVSYADNIVPCKAGCPAGTDIPRYLRYIKSGDYDRAVAVIREKLPFPKSLGRICDHPCESGCKRSELNEPISICKLKRSAADSAQSSEWKSRALSLPPTGKSAAVIGAGPAGLTAAYYLAKKGHAVTVFEKNEKAGGQCRYGIPSYRLPDEVLDDEIGEILSAGIKLETKSSISSPAELLSKGFEAVLVATGTHKGVTLPVDGSSLSGVTKNTDFLRDVRNGTLTSLSGSVVVLGGGNVAFDCARTAIRLGASEAHVVCLEAAENMTAHKLEIEEGVEEGVIIHASQNVLRIVGESCVLGVEIEKIKSFEFDENAMAVLTLVEDSKETIPCSAFIFAVGQKPEGTEGMGIELFRNAYATTDEDGRTNLKGVFAAGDVVYGTKSVVEAIASGRKSAAAMDKFLGGDGDITETLTDYEEPNPYIGKENGFADLERRNPSALDSEHRRKCFEEVELCLEPDATCSEASRCLQCDLRLNLTRPKLWNEYERRE